MKRKGLLIFSGYNMRGIIAFCRFCKLENVSFSIVALGNNDPILQTDYIENVIVTRNSTALTVSDILEYAKKTKHILKLKEIVLFPSTEFLNRFLLANRTELEQEGLIIPLCDENLYITISDKYSFGEICSQNKIRIPKEYKDINSISLPFVAKPQKYFSDYKNKIEKPLIITDENSLREFKKLPNIASYYFQEFIGGKSIYLLYYFSNNGDYSIYAQENLIQQSKGRSIIAAKSINFHNKDLIKQYASLLTSLHFRGLIMIEIKHFQNNYYMIEANPRLWGPSQLILDAGMNLFHLFGLDFGLISKVKKQQFKPETNYFWSGGIIEDQKNQDFPVFHDYSEKQFFEDYKKMIDYDIYRKNDTINIYFSEITS